MNGRNTDREFITFLQDALPPMDEAAQPTDLWLRLRQRLEVTPPSADWLDWVLVVLVLALLVRFPEALLLVLYHL